MKFIVLLMLISYIKTVVLNLKELIMKFILKTIAVLAVTATVAYAACPPSAPYRCVPGPGGKQLCGCGY